MNKLLVIGIIQASYIIYMLNYFKTKYSLAHPLLNFNSNYLKHPIGKSDKPISNICNFGHQSSWLIALFVLLRPFLLCKNIKNISILLLIIVITFSFLNFNAVIYLLPYFFVEIYLIKKNFII
jgi:hypothetical protein